PEKVGLSITAKLPAELVRLVPVREVKLLLLIVKFWPEAIVNPALTVTSPEALTTPKVELPETFKAPLIIDGPVTDKPDWATNVLVILAEPPTPKDPVVFKGPVI